MESFRIRNFSEPAFGCPVGLVVSSFSSGSRASNPPLVYHKSQPARSSSKLTSQLKMEELQPPLKYRNATWHYYRFDGSSNASDQGTTSSSLDRNRRQYFHTPVHDHESSPQKDRHHPPVAHGVRRRRIDVTAVAPRLLAHGADGSEGFPAECDDDVVLRRIRVERKEPWFHFISKLDFIRRRIPSNGNIFRWICPFYIVLHHCFRNSVWEPCVRVLTSPRGATVSLAVHFLLWLLILWRILEPAGTKP
jgi:hypothetical protein